MTINHAAGSHQPVSLSRPSLPGWIFALVMVVVAPSSRATSANLQQVPPPVQQSDDQTLVPGFPEYPSLTPDGSRIIFSWAGDLWIVPARGGVASRLTAHPAVERRSAVSPDGRFLAFESDRDGVRSLYVSTLYSVTTSDAPSTLVPGVPLRLTTLDRPLALSGFAPDGRSVLFAGDLEPAISRGTRMYAAPLATLPRGVDSATQPSTARGSLPAEQVPDTGAPAQTISPGPITRLCNAFGAAPRVAADGRSMVFQRGNAGPERPTYRGSGQHDLWRYDFDGSAYTRLTRSPANDFDPWPLPDGSLLFISSRDGQNNLYRLASGDDDSAARPLTAFRPQPDQPSIGHGVRDLAVSADGSTAVFAVWDRLYRLDLKVPGAEPVALNLRVPGDLASLDWMRINVGKEVTEAVLSPDGKTLAVIARGEVFIRSSQENRPSRRVTDTPGRERSLAWSPDGVRLYFASDDPSFRTATSADPANLASQNSIVYATVELSRDDLNPEPQPPASTSGGDKPAAETPAASANAEDKAPGGQADAKIPEPAKPEPAKPDSSKIDPGKRWAESLRFRLRTLVSGEFDARSPVPSPDGYRLLYTRGLGDLVLHDLATGEQDTVVSSWDDPEVVWTSDSRTIVYAAQDLDFNSDLWIMDLGPRADAHAQTDPAAIHTVAAAPLPLRTPVNLTQHPDLDLAPRISADGKLLTFLSDRSGENFEFDIFTLWLDKDLEGRPAYDRDEYFKKAAEFASKRKPVEPPPHTRAELPTQPVPSAQAAQPGEAGKPAESAVDSSKPAKPAVPPKPIRVDHDDAYLRVRRFIAAGAGASTLELLPGGDRVAFTTTIDNEPALVSVDHKGEDRKTIQSGAVSAVRATLTGDKLTFIRSGVATAAPKAGGKAEPFPVEAVINVDVPREQRQKFLEAAKIVGSIFYHPTLKGLDWPALTARYLALAERTRTRDALNRVANLFFGELDGSHLGMSGGGGFVGQTITPAATGYLGIVAAPAPGGYRIERITRGGPAQNATPRLVVGQTIVAIDGRRLAPDELSLPTLDLAEVLSGKAGKESLIELAAAPSTNGADHSAPAGPQSRFSLLTPVGWATWDRLRYEEEVLERRARVEELSKGALGYLHILSMSDASVRDFERDLYAAAHGKRGLIIDVRDNGGGSTADILLSSLTAPRHAWTAPRGVDPMAVPKDSYPRDRRLIHAWTRPVNVLINQHSFSNAEIFAHAIKTIGRGRLVGTPTFGGVISTGSASLIDGATVRTPFRGWYLTDGTDMENNGAEPDLPVEQTPADEEIGRDPQLEAAVKDLLNRLE